MITPEEIVPTLESILADEAVFISKLQMMKPRSKTSDEVRELEEEVFPICESMTEMVEALVSNRPDPKPIGDKFKIAFNNVGVIYELLTGLIDKPAK
ncbi:MAG TPA: hypothetical protein VLX91_03005 [Candidatus Acidoferrales bacterium]|nr:hypothetical protein [Candidatus Acidoferrales bacterium]